MTEDIVIQLEYYVTNETRMPAGLVVSVIEEIQRLRSLYDEAYDACRYALANSPRWQENATTVIADYESEKTRRG